MSLRLLALLVAAAALPARAEPWPDCQPGDDRCLRAARELAEAWDRCPRPRLVVDETAYSAGRRRLQGVWCELEDGTGIFHSAPVAWEWVAATGRSLRPGRDACAERWLGPRGHPGERLPADCPASLAETLRTRWRPREPQRRVLDDGPLARLVADRLAFPGSRLAAASLLWVGEDRVLVVERQPLGDLRPEDLPWGLLPWRPAALALPALSEAERAVLRQATVQLVIRLPGEDACLGNTLGGERLLEEGPWTQDATARPFSCRAYAAALTAEAERHGAPPGQREESPFQTALRALLTPPTPPAFARAASPNVDAFPVHRIP